MSFAVRRMASTERIGSIMEQREFSLADIFCLIVKRFWIILIAAVLGAAVALYYSLFLMTPRYQAVTKYYVDTTGQTMLDSTVDTSSTSIKTQRETVLSRMVVPSYIEILQTRNFAAHIADKLKDNPNLSEERQLRPYTENELYAAIRYTYQEELESYTVTVTVGDPVDAYIIANCIEAESEPYLIEKKPSAENTLRIIDNARYSEASITLSTPIYLVLGFLVGALIAIVICFIIENNDVCIYDEKSLTTMGLTVLGTIPDYIPDQGTKKAAPTLLSNR